MYLTDDNKCSDLYCERLKDWLEAKRSGDKSFKDQDFADDVGLSASRLSDIKNGRRQFVSPSVINNIAIATGQLVTLSDYVDEASNTITAPEEGSDE